MTNSRDFAARWQGYGTPLTERGAAVAYGPPPWRMRGSALVVRFQLDNPDEVLRHIPSEMQIDEDPVLRATFWDLEHDAGLPALVDQLGHWFRFREASIALPVRAFDRVGDNTVYMYADDARYIAFGREVMGWPVQFGDIRLEQQHVGNGDALVGERHSGSLWAEGLRVMEMQLRLTNRSTTASVQMASPKWITQKIIPSVFAGPASLSQTVWTAPSEFVIGDVWEASGTLDMHEAPGFELHHLRPRKISSALYLGSIQITIGFGQVLHQV